VSYVYEGQIFFYAEKQGLSLASLAKKLLSVTISPTVRMFVEWVPTRGWAFQLQNITPCQNLPEQMSHFLIQY